MSMVTSFVRPSDFKRELETIKRTYGTALEQIAAHDAEFDRWLTEEVALEPEARDRLLQELANIRADRRVFREGRDSSEAVARALAHDIESAREGEKLYQQKWVEAVRERDEMRAAIRLLLEQAAK